MIGTSQLAIVSECVTILTIYTTIPVFLSPRSLSHLNDQWNCAILDTLGFVLSLSHPAIFLPMINPHINVYGRFVIVTNFVNVQSIAFEMCAFLRYILMLSTKYNEIKLCSVDIGNTLCISLCTSVVIWSNIIVHSLTRNDNGTYNFDIVCICIALVALYPFKTQQVKIFLRTTFVLTVDFRLCKCYWRAQLTLGHKMPLGLLSFIHQDKGLDRIHYT